VGGRALAELLFAETAVSCVELGTFCDAAEPDYCTDLTVLLSMAGNHNLSTSWSAF